MKPDMEKAARLMRALRLETPLVALYDCPPGPGFEPMLQASGRACCFAYYGRWQEEKTLVVSRGGDDFARPSHGCPGLHRALGLSDAYPPWMAHFLTDGENGAPMGEGLKAAPELAAEFLARSRPMTPAGDHLLLGPLRAEAWEAVRAVTFFADPDRLSALMTLAAYWTADPDEIAAPFSSGCGLLWRDLVDQGRDRAVLGCTDIAMRRHLPPDLLCLTVTPARFLRMIDFPPGCFLEKEWWRDLMKARGR